MSKVTLKPYDEKWSEQFQIVAAELTAIPGIKDLPLHHIGSTAITGIDAKDVIDVQLGVDDFRRVDQFQTRLTDLGYACITQLTDHIPAYLNDDASLWAKQFWTTEQRVPKVNLHIRQINNPNWRFALLFRDYLRAEPVMAAAYVAAKRAISQAVDAPQYSTVKDPVIDIIMLAAEHWAEKSNWTPDPTGQ